jgi:hypothetical protein
MTDQAAAMSPGHGPEPLNGAPACPETTRPLAKLLLRGEQLVAHRDQLVLYRT